MLFRSAFHTTPICSPNRASILTGQYASRHGIIDNVARDGASHRLPNYHLQLQQLGYETAHIGKWHMGNDGKPRPGYDHWVSFDGHGRLTDPELNEQGRYVQHSGYITDILNSMALNFVERRHDKPWSLFFAHKAVHPDAEQAADGTLAVTGYVPASRHRHLYEGCRFPKKPNMLSPDEVIRQKPAWTEAFEIKRTERSQQLLKPIHSGEQEEIRLRAAMIRVYPQLRDTPITHSWSGHLGLTFDTLPHLGRVDGLHYALGYSPDEANSSYAHMLVNTSGFEVNNVVIQFCESYSNTTGGAKDGGGFHLDNSTSNSVMFPR